jgi:hypothetical protein
MQLIHTATKRFANLQQLQKEAILVMQHKNMASLSTCFCCPHGRRKRWSLFPLKISRSCQILTSFLQVRHNDPEIIRTVQKLAEIRTVNVHINLGLVGAMWGQLSSAHGRQQGGQFRHPPPFQHVSGRE